MSAVNQNSFRFDKGRSGVEKDTNVNIQFRGYFAIDDHILNIVKQYLKQKGGITKFLAPYVETINAGFCSCDPALKDAMPSRIQLFFNPLDNFFSIVVGWRVPAKLKSAVKANTLKFNIGYFLGAAGLNYCFCNTWEAHKGVDAFDDSHCDDAPVLDLKLNYLQENYQQAFGNQQIVDIQAIENNFKPKKGGGRTNVVANFVKDIEGSTSAIKGLDVPVNNAEGEPSPIDIKIEGLDVTEPGPEGATNPSPAPDSTKKPSPTAEGAKTQQAITGLDGPDNKAKDDGPKGFGSKTSKKASEGGSK